jgi:2-iminobutanoate/2-iminopropanoate deaminase
LATFDAVVTYTPAAAAMSASVTRRFELPVCGPTAPALLNPRSPSPARGSVGLAWILGPLKASQLSCGLRTEGLDERQSQDHRPRPRAEHRRLFACPEGRRLVFISGQGPIGSKGRVVPGAIGAQTRPTLQNVRRLIEAAGGRMEHIVKCTCYLADVGAFAEFDVAYREFFADPLPCRTTVGAGLDGIGVEIDAIAYVAS